MLNAASVPPPLSCSPQHHEQRAECHCLLQRHPHHHQPQPRMWVQGRQKTDRETTREMHISSVHPGLCHQLCMRRARAVDNATVRKQQREAIDRGARRHGKKTRCMTKSNTQTTPSLHVPINLRLPLQRASGQTRIARREHNRMHMKGSHDIHDTNTHSWLAVVVVVMMGGCWEQHQAHRRTLPRRKWK